MSSADVAYWPNALKNGVDLRTGARVREITIDAAGRARGVWYYDPDGRAREARARVVVLCASGLGTPRLLLLSRSSRFPNGLANSSGLVGKNLMVHVQSFAVGRFDNPVDDWQGTWGGSVSTRHHYETDRSRGYVRGFIMSGCMGWSPLNLASQVAPWGVDHHAAIDRYLNHEIVLYLCGDDLPEPENRVELDWDNLDACGLPGVRTYYRLGENSQRLGRDMLRTAHEALTAAGASSVRDFGLSPIWGWHLLGTARMGNDPGASVVDAHNRAHDAPNLFIVDGSSLPTGGGVNPTSTIQALALRCAEYIWEQRAAW
jgi:choline dehydrogenase-like flavoprotein